MDVPCCTALNPIRETKVNDGERLTFEKSMLQPAVAMKVGVLFSGGPAPGGHAFLYGLGKALFEIHDKIELLGFLEGAKGLIGCNFMKLDMKTLAAYESLGGFHLLGTSRKKIEDPDDFAKIEEVILKLGLSAIVFVGGDDTHTNAYHLGKYLEKKMLPTTIVAAPKTIDGDVKSQDIKQSFGFDTATRVYSELIGNLGTDLLSTKKYWHFVRLMGRKASHVTLECALQTEPNLALISEEVEREKMTLNSLVDHIVELVIERKKVKKPYGLVLIPEGLIEFIPEMKELLGELNRLLAAGKDAASLSEKSRAVFDLLPPAFQRELQSERDSHGNIGLSHIKTEELLKEIVMERLTREGQNGEISILGHFYGYEGRCSPPSDFDRIYCTNLGRVAAALVYHRKSLTVAALDRLEESPVNWQPVGAFMEKAMGVEMRSGKEKRVVQKALVDLKGKPFQHFASKRKQARLADRYSAPGPMQLGFFSKVQITKTLELELQ
ncbi:MAG: hypothetical protein A3F09_04880 [Chlamydiae bacterium RIFCSPHIGHO2_12_FULL_49_11]|nr:MAG: hypothetical protein A3F09_04880 [Chlamydiae bacterium RIFCSPHIGHO2_12_FULL_49_11]